MGARALRARTVSHTGRYTPGMEPPRWTEPLLRALEPDEHDFQEFKGRGFLLDEGGEVRSTFLHDLSKQVGAFANGGGGRLFLGLDDDGVVDGGLPTTLRGGTRAWLEDLVPHAVDPPLQACNVFEVRPELPDTRIEHGHAVYVVDVPGSDRAPHQSKDHRYYLRIAGKSRPMGHVHVQDVLRRTGQPRLQLTRVGPYGDAELDESDPRGPRAFVQLRAFVANQGRTLATHVGLELVVPRPFAGTEVVRRMRTAGETIQSQSPGHITFFRYHGVPVFPTQEVYVGSVWVSLHRNNVALVRGGAAVDCVIYADDAQPVRTSRELRAFAVVQRALQWLETR